MSFLNLIYGKGGDKLDLINTNLPYRPDTRYLSCKTDCILSCGEKLDGRTHPLQLDKEGAVSALRNASAYAQAGWYFSVVEFFVVPNDGRFLAITFENPMANNKVMYLDKVTAGLFVNQVTGTRIGNEEGLQLTITEQPSLELIIDTLTPLNNRIGSPNTSTIIARTVGAVSLSNARFTANYPSGEIKQEFEGQIILPPGNNLLVFIEPSADNINNALLDATVSWWELPTKEDKKNKGKTDEEKNTKEDCIQEKATIS